MPVPRPRPQHIAFVGQLRGHFRNQRESFQLSLAMTREMSHDGSEKHKPSRKSHRKSRNGCDNCKRRRIKCNEVKPQCSNCIKHSDRCSFLLQHAPSIFSLGSVTTHDELSSLRASSQSSSPAFTPASVSTFPGSIEPSLQDPRIQTAFSILDMELLHNYETSTCYTLSNVPSMQTFMRISMPKMGFTHPFVLHSLLSVSALHLSRFKKGAADFYVSQAEHHYVIALNTATSLMPNINQDNCAALYTFATLCSIYHLAMGPKSGDFLIFSDNGIAEWKLLFRGVKAIIEANPWLLRESELAPMFEVSIRQLNLPSRNNSHIQDLREHIVETSSDHPKFDLYIKTLELLGESYLSNPTTGARSQSPQPLAFAWLYRVSDEFVQSLQEREPIALVIFAHFCVLLHDMSLHWWLPGWVDHLMSEIYACLNGEHKMWIRWPMEEIGWIPQ